MVDVTNYQVNRWETVDPLGQTVLHVAGVANIEVNNPRTDKEWHRFEVDILLENVEWAGRFEVKVPNVSLAAISNQNESVFAGWAADLSEFHEEHDKPYIRAQLAVRDIDGELHRVSFTAIVVGQKYATTVLPILTTLPTHVIQKALDYKAKQAK
jgi:hypothetical protein